MKIDVEQAVLSAVNLVSENGLTALDHAARIEQIGLDSIGLTEVILRIEENLGMEISEPVLLEVADATTVGQFLKILSDYYSTR